MLRALYGCFVVLREITPYCLLLKNSNNFLLALILTKDGSLLFDKSLRGNGFSSPVHKI
jgi:hypothetical protein